VPFIDDAEALDAPRVGGLVESEVERSHVVWSLSMKPFGIV